MDVSQRLVLVAFTVFTLCGCALGTCDPKMVEKITATWNGTSPPSVLEQPGTMTYVYLSRVFLQGYNNDVYCIATKHLSNKKGAADIVVYKNLINKSRLDYTKHENNGKITFEINGHEYIQYVISFKNHVLLFWECMPYDETGKYDSMVGIAVDIEHVDDEVARAEVEVAKKTLEFLGLAKGVDVTPCVPELIFYKKKKNKRASL